MAPKDTAYYSVATDDYIPTPSMFERRCTHFLVKTLFRGLPVALDFGNGDLRDISAGTSAIHFAPPRFLALLGILVHPGLRLGEAYMDGKWYLSRGLLSDFLLMLVTAKGSTRVQNGLNFGFFEWATHIYKQFLATFSATRKVVSHYDVNAKVFRRMIGDHYAYSCAFFDDPGMSLDQAQQHKFDTIFRRMQLSTLPKPKILDVGCGWGSFERFLPSDQGAEIDAISISGNQIADAANWAASRPGNPRSEVRFLKEDYRDFCMRHPNAYDRVVSIGMLEHVGRSKYEHFFRNIRNVLADDGVALVHSIVKHSPKTTNLWIDRYIFPGGYAPLVSEVVLGIERSGLKIRAIHYHDGENYIRTLRCWLTNLLENEAEILAEFAAEQIKIPDTERDKIARSTFRMFIYYLSAVQLMFHRDYWQDGVAHFVVTR